MAYFRRITLFVLTNLAVLLLLGIVVRVLGLDQWLAAEGLNLPLLLGFAGVLGFSGSIFSLLISKPMAKMSTGARVITAPSTRYEAWLLDTVRRQAAALGIGMPEVAVFPSPEPNAFATGAFRNSALVAVSSGLLEHMEADEVEAVLGHELAHVANGDMVTMTLLQGVLNTFVIFFSRVLGLVFDSALRRGSDDRRSVGMGYYLGVVVSEIFLGFFATLIVMAYSRRREFRADAGGAALAGRGKMIAALRALQRVQARTSIMPKGLAAFGITAPRGWTRWLRSHPPLEERIAALETAQH